MKNILYILFFILNTQLLAINIDERSSDIDILSNSRVLITSNTTTYKDVVNNKHFNQNNRSTLGLGFVPEKALWIKFKLKNSTNKKLNKILELTNAITESIILYDGEKTYTDGMWNMQSSRTTLHPVFNISLEANEEKLFYIKASSQISSLIAQLKLWNNEDFLYSQYKHSTYLFIFFTIIMTLFIYNFVIMIFTKDKAYLYYILYLFSLVFFQAFYLGIFQLYLFSQELTIVVGKASMIYISFLIISIVLFTREFLNIYKFPKLDKVLKYYLYIAPFIAISSYNNIIFNMNMIVIFIPLGLYVLFLSFYSLFKGVKEAKYYVVGWGIVILSLILLNLKTLGFFDITIYFKYVNELSYSLEAFLFSIALAHRIKTLNEQKSKLDAQLINFQKHEQQKLQKLVDEKTKTLQDLLDEKDLLYNELNHRVKNNLSMILSLVKLQISKSKNIQTKHELNITKNRIDSISKLYESLNNNKISTDTSTKEYFYNIENNIRLSINKEVDVNHTVECDLDFNQLVYCGLIVNELLTNSFKYAFENQYNSTIDISLTKTNNICILSLEDNGSGFKKDQKDSLGLTIVKTLVEKQLYGTMDINSNNGTKITIKWEDKNG